jgi:nucleoside-diphosphate-sugar epimerase
MGGTRFIGRPLVAQLLAAGHSLSLFTRGRQPLPQGVEHLQGDRTTAEGLGLLRRNEEHVAPDLALFESRTRQRGGKRPQSDGAGEVNEEGDEDESAAGGRKAMKRSRNR